MTKRKGKKTRNQGDGGTSQQGSQAQSTSNRGFSLTVKQLYRFIQVIHHLGIMMAQKEGTVVRSFRHKGAELASFMKPACPDTDVEKALAEVAQTWIGGATDVLISHYTKVKTTLGMQLRMHTLSDTDFDKAKSLALSWAKKNFGKKLGSSTLEKFEELCTDLKSKNIDHGKEKAQPASFANVTASVIDVSKTPKRKPVREVSLSPQSASPPAKQLNTQGTTTPTEPSGPASPISSTSAQPKPQEVRSQPKKPRTMFRSYKASGQWVLPPITAKTAALGDSNLSRVTKSRVSEKELKVCSYPGAKFYNLKGLLANVTQPCKSVKNLILSLGINERDNNVKATCPQSLSKLLKEVKRVFPEAKIFMASLQWDAKKVTETQNTNLESLNDLLTNRKDITVLPQLTQSAFKIDPMDKYGIHWAKETANDMLDMWLDNLN